MDRIAFFELEEWEIDALNIEFGAGNSYSKEPLLERNVSLADDADCLCVFIYSKVGRELLDKMPKLKLIATRSTGFDHIDLAACKERGIAVCNVPSYGENTVAEHTFALILSISRKIPYSYERTRQWDFTLDGLRGFDLKGKTIGVIGTGKIGQHVIRIAKGFEMEVVASDTFPRNDLAWAMGFKYLDIDELCKAADIITLHVPYSKETHHLIDAKRIAEMKKGAILINTARGGLVDTLALAKALSEGKLGGAGLDVLEAEGYVKEEMQLLSDNVPMEALKASLENHLLLKLPNVIITPHNAFNSKEALERILTTTVANIKGFPERMNEVLPKD